MTIEIAITIAGVAASMMGSAFIAGRFVQGMKAKVDAVAIETHEQRVAATRHEEADRAAHDTALNAQAQAERERALLRQALDEQIKDLAKLEERTHRHGQELTRVLGTERELATLQGSMKEHNDNDLAQFNRLRDTYHELAGNVQVIGTYVEIMSEKKFQFLRRRSGDSQDGQ